MNDDLAQALAGGVAVASLLDEYVYGRGTFWDPALPYHRTPRRCPFCDQAYYTHAGFADHRDRCNEGPNPGANPVGSVDGGNDD